jgi:hypothetical protein
MAGAMMPIEQIPYAGWKDCLRLSNGRIELVVTTEVGPRILRFGAVGGQNLLHEVPEHAGLKGGTEWRSLGGHRLWHGPEAKPRTYAPDNAPVRFEIQPDGVSLLQDVEPSTGIRKAMEIRLDPERDGVQVRHRLTNLSPWPVELAPWAITIMAPGGVAIVPQEPFAPHPDFQVGRASNGQEEPPSYLPARSLALWSYTRLNDSRWRFLDRYILLYQDPAIASPLKFGVSNRQEWCSYVRNGEMLLKRFPLQADGRYPDEGCNNEIFTNADMLELESLGPLNTLRPGESVEHDEAWFYFRDIALSAEDDALEATLRAALESSKTR